MQTVNREQFGSILRGLGINQGDSLLVHSALQFLGQPEGGIGMYCDALCEELGNAKGTIAVPTFNFTFARGKPFDPKNTTSNGVGVLSEYVRLLPGALRTSHPMHSLAVIGCHAPDLAGCDTPSAFDPGSAFEKMLELDFKLLLLGADIQSVSMVHYCEQRARVPYRYWKQFTGLVRIYPPDAESEGEWWTTRTYRMFVRDLDIDPQLNLSPVQHLLEERGQWASQSLNYGRVSTCRLVDFVKATDELLAADPWALVDNPPDVIRNT